MSTWNSVYSVSLISSVPAHSTMTKRRHGSGGNSNRNKKISRSLSVDNVNSGLLADGSSNTQPDPPGYSSSQPTAVVNTIPNTDPDQVRDQDRDQDAICKVCKKNTRFNIFEVNALQCSICKDVSHGSCLNIDESLLPFIYVIKEVGGWCCTSCRSSPQTARNSKGKLPTTSVSQQSIDVLTRELSDIKSSLLVVTQALRTASSNNSRATGGRSDVDLSQTSSFNINPGGGRGWRALKDPCSNYLVHKSSSTRGQDLVKHHMSIFTTRCQPSFGSPYGHAYRAPIRV